MKGLIHIYTGDGKGKTTAAVGLVVRMAGYQKKTLFTQFLKDGSSNEISMLMQMKQVDVYSCKEKMKFVFMMNDSEKKDASSVIQNYFENVVKMIQKEEYDLLVLDEILDAIGTKLLQEQSLIDFLQNKPEKLEVVLTGRNPSQKLVEFADYVTKMEKEKHPFDQGLSAREGIEY